MSKWFLVPIAGYGILGLAAFASGCGPMWLFVSGAAFGAGFVIALVEFVGLGYKKQ